MKSLRDRSPTQHNEEWPEYEERKQKLEEEKARKVLEGIAEKGEDDDDL